MNRRVSVVMAACNGEDFIEAQIASIIQQLDERDELVISLDPSTDRTESLISGFQDQRIRLLKGPGQGVVSNVENGLNAAHGDYIFLADQDDIWCSRKLKVVLDALKKDDTLLVLHDCRIIDENLSELESSYFQWHGTKKGFWSNLLRNSFIGCCMAFKRSLLDRALPFPKNLPMHDQWLGLTACRTGKVRYLKEPLIDYRRHSNNQSSLSHADILTMIRWRLTLIRILKERKLI